MKNNNIIGHASIDNRYNLPLSVVPLVLPSLSKLPNFAVGAAQFGKQLHGKSGVCINNNDNQIKFCFILDICSIVCSSTIFCLLRFI